MDNNSNKEYSKEYEILENLKTVNALGFYTDNSQPNIHEFINIKKVKDSYLYKCYQQRAYLCGFIQYNQKLLDYFETFNEIIFSF